MLNEPSTQSGGSPKPSPRHPLEERDAKPSPKPRQQIMLHIPTVRPYMTYLFVGIMVIVFLVRVISPALDLEIYLWGANHQPDVLEKGEFYRLFTSIFLHSGIYAPDGSMALQNGTHLLMNVYLLFVSGGSVERFFGHWRFNILFLLGGLTGSILSCVLNPPVIYSVGASGAVFAILSAEFIYIYRHRKLLGAQAQVQLTYLIILAVANLMIGILGNAGGSGMRVDNWAHVGGALGGMLLGLVITPDLIFKRHPAIQTELLAEDRNPLRLHYRALSLYVAALLSVLIVASQVIV